MMMMMMPDDDDDDDDDNDDMTFQKFILKWYSDTTKCPRDCENVIFVTGTPYTVAPFPHI